MVVKKLCCLVWCISKIKMPLNYFCVVSVRKSHGSSPVHNFGFSYCHCYTCRKWWCLGECIPAAGAKNHGGDEQNTASGASVTTKSPPPEIGCRGHAKLWQKHINQQAYGLEGKNLMTNIWFFLHVVPSNICLNLVLLIIHMNKLVSMYHLQRNFFYPNFA